MRRFLILNFAFCILHFAMVSNALAVPDTSSVRVTDVTTTSFSVVWMSDVPADPEVEVYADSTMATRITDKCVITSMPTANPKVSGAAKARGIMKVRVSGLSSSTKYYVRTLTKDPSNPQSIGYSSIYEVITASKVMPYKYTDNRPEGFANDLSSFKVYIRPSDKDPEPGLGDLIVLEENGALYPLSAFAGDWINSPESVIDLNNLFGLDSRSLDISGGEKITLRIYRGGGISTLTHYRRAAQDSNMVYVSEPVKGFFADINLDGKIDDEDFAEFKKQYRTLPDDVTYNPDFDFVEDTEGKVDAREFSKFSREYGRTDVK
ncbi:MAG: hypothetical protein Q8M71_11070 [Thermodesulfovibrionales bacterium]|nr:hypothetical protein [Thermodesulfovibrionales bacterium]